MPSCALSCTACRARQRIAVKKQQEKKLRLHQRLHPEDSTITSHPLSCTAKGKIFCRNPLAKVPQSQKKGHREGRDISPRQFKDSTVCDVICEFLSPSHSHLLAHASARTREAEVAKAGRRDGRRLPVSLCVVSCIARRCACCSWPRCGIVCRPRVTGIGQFAPQR